MTRLARLNASSLVALGCAAVVIATGLATGCGTSEGTQTQAGSTAEATSETTEETGETGETGQTGETGETGETETGETDTGETEDPEGCPEGGSGNCTFLLHCPEGDYEYKISGTAATTATIISATPDVVGVPTTPARSVNDVVAVTLEVDEEQVMLTTLCADGITSVQATRPLEATNG